LFYIGVKFDSSPTGRTLPEVVKGILFKGEQLEGGVKTALSNKFY
jgi:hypothetical protein